MLPRHFCSPALRRRSLEPCTWYVHCEVVRCGLFTSICRPICPVEKVTGFRTGNPRFESWPGHFDAQLRRLPHSALMSCTLLKAVSWPVGLMDKASASGAGDSRFESWAGQSHVQLCSPGTFAAQLFGDGALSPAHGTSTVKSYGAGSSLASAGQFARWKKSLASEPEIPGSSPGRATLMHSCGGSLILR